MATETTKPPFRSIVETLAARIGEARNMVGQQADALALDADLVEHHRRNGNILADLEDVALEAVRKASALALELRKVAEMEG